MDNERLNQYYEEQGFLWCGQCEEGPYKGFLEKRFWVNEMKKKESIYLD